MIFNIMLILLGLVGQSIGVLMGTLFPMHTAYFFGPFTCLPNIIFSGYYFSLRPIPYNLRWLTFISSMKFALEGLLITIYGFDRAEFSCEALLQTGEMQRTNCLKPEQILQEMGVTMSIYADMIVLIVHFLILRGLCYLALRHRLRAVK